MSETKTYVFGNEGSSVLNSVLPLLQQRGIDPACLYGLMGNNNGGLFGGRGFEDIIALIIVAAIFGNGNFGFGGWGNNGANGANIVASTAEREMLLSAIQRNGVDLSQLASAINCSVGRVHDAVGDVSTQICNLAGQNGLSFQQTINAIQAGNAAISTQLCNCCCEITKAISDSNYLTERGFCNTNQILSQGFSSVAYETQRQTCDIEKAIADSTAQILAGQAAIEKRELQREIATLQEEKQTYKLGNMIAAATSPILSEVESIKCKLPKTEVITAQPEYVAVNRSINVGYAPYCGYGFGSGFGLGNGWTGWGGNCGCSSNLWG